MSAQTRYDMYAFIHKGLRLGMVECLESLSTVDALDNAEFDDVVESILHFLDVCESHVHHENDFVHPAMEERMPGSSRAIAEQHVNHEKQIAQLKGELARIKLLPGIRRCESLHPYYREFASWVAENFIHMEQEEVENNQVLWTCYSDNELIAIEQNLVSHISPEMMPSIQSLMVRAMTPEERAGFFRLIQGGMPVELFTDLIESLGSQLVPTAFKKLLLALDMDFRPQAVAV